MFVNYLLKLRTLNNGHRMVVRNISTGKFALFAGHSKWANIRHIKAAKDGQKAALFTKISRQIRLAIQDGGSSDPSLNSQLKSVIDEALRKNMPMSTIKNNIQKCGQNKNFLNRYKVDLRYRQKVFAVCIIYTDNYAAVKMEMATVLRKSGAIISEASHLFEEIGLVQTVFDKSRLQAGNDIHDLIMEDAIEFGAEDVEVIDKENGIVNNVIQLLPEESIEYQKFISKLKDIPGVEEIYDNIDTM